MSTIAPIIRSKSSQLRQFSIFSTCRSASTTSQPPRKFNQTVLLTNGASITTTSTSPLNPRIKLTRDTRNHPVWNPKAEKEGLNDESGRLAKFSKKFGNMEDMDFEADIEEASVGSKKA